jgi:AbrB family looped-hinge helix DNA binding protein
MTQVAVSNKGQVTLPAPMRRRLGIKSRSKVEVEIRESEIVIRPAKTIRDVAGIFAQYAKGKTTDWNEIREQVEQAVAEEVAHEGLD